MRKGTNGEDGYSAFSMRDATTHETIPTELGALLKEADDYYSQEDYKDDRMVKGKAMHPRLLAAWDALMVDLNYGRRRPSGVSVIQLTRKGIIGHQPAPSERLPQRDAARRESRDREPRYCGDQQDRDERQKRNPCIAPPLACEVIDGDPLDIPRNATDAA